MFYSRTFGLRQAPQTQTQLPPVFEAAVLLKAPSLAYWALLRGLWGAAIAVMFFAISGAAQAAAASCTNPLSGYAAGATDVCVINPDVWESNVPAGLTLFIKGGAYQITKSVSNYNTSQQVYKGSSYPGSLQVMLYAEGVLTKSGRAGNWPWGIAGFTPPSALTWGITSSTIEQTTPGTWRAVEVLSTVINTRTYQLTVTTTYTSPRLYADVTFDLAVPVGAPNNPMLYMATDFVLDGNDYGPGDTRDVGGRRFVGQAIKSGTTVTAVGGLIEGLIGTGFTSYYEAAYECVFGAAQFYNYFGQLVNCPGGSVGPQNGTPYPNTIDSSSQTDAGVGAHWDLGTGVAGTTVTRSVQLYFAADYPTPPGYTVGGTVSGLAAGKSVVLQNNSGDDLTAAADGAFTFTSLVNSGSAYAVTVKTQPTGQQCVVSDGSGTASANVTNVTVRCYDRSAASSGGSVNATITGGTCAGFDRSTISFGAPVNPPANAGNFSYGVFGFTAKACGAGGTVTVTLKYPRTLPPGTRYWKQINGAWVDWTSKVTIQGDSVILTIADGGEGDANPSPGEISDPSGPAFPEDASKVPVFSPWMLGVLGLLLGFAGYRGAGLFARAQTLPRR